MASSEITVQDLHELGPEVRLIDVREPTEWADAHVPFAELIPMASVPEHLDRFDGSPTYVICRSGGRSAQVCAFAAQRGLDVVNVNGGVLAWAQAGYETVGGS